MAATIHLVRHAVTEATGSRLGGRTQASLSEKGQAQAAVTRDVLAGTKFGAVYASPLPRTTETAEIIARPHRLKVRDAPGVIEMDFGRWTDKPLKPLFKHKLWPVIQQTPSLVTFPDGESMRGAQARAVDQIEAIAAKHNAKNVIVTSHADIIKMLIAFYSGMPFDTFQRLRVDPASVTVISTGKGERPVVHSTNHVPYGGELR
ncbi:histidine phosphatase family protein [Euzebya tangerina]|uniref:histidine phosphatase family protein n=1 Tax=Euzebya tangerina TaxID=591198 RepID=UPI000E30C372|nr:histidine phosphatase family protein [Euzebya tangerina]